MEKKDPKTRTLEELLLDLRTQKNWTYLDIVNELSKLGLIVDEKTVKKWEFGLSYPDLETIYKLSELYLVSSEDFLNAKEISYQKSYNSIHMTLIKWICYFTGFTLIYGRFLFYIILAVVLVCALIFIANPLGFLDWLLEITNS